MKEDEAEKLTETIFDEVKEVHVEMVNGKPRMTDEETIARMEAQEMENACAELVHSWRRFKEIDDRPGAATDPKLEVEWWRRLDALGLADGSLKAQFLGRDRSPASIRHYAKFRRKMVLGERYRTDA